MTVSKKIILLILITFLPILCVFGIFQYLHSYKKHIDQLNVNSNRFMKRLAYNAAIPVWDLDIDQCKTIVELEMQDPSIVSVVIKESDSRIFAAFSRNDNWAIVDGELDDDIANNLILKSQEMFLDNKVIGTVFVYTTDTFIKKDFFYNTVKTILITVFLISIMVLVLVMSLKKIIIHPVLTLVDDVEIIGKGNFEHIAEVNTNDEFAVLANSLNYLNKEIIEHKKTQRELKIANKDLIESQEALHNLLADLTTANENLRQTQNQLVQSEKLASIGLLAAGIAHEINNPLSFINLNIITLGKYLSNIKDFYNKFKEDMVINDVFPEEIKNTIEDLTLTAKKKRIDFILVDVESVFDDIKDGIERIKKIVLDLKFYAREDSAEDTLVNLNDVIESAINISWNELKYKVEVKKEFGDIPKINISSQRIAQVFINLLVNAAQAIKEKGVVTIRTFYLDEKVHVEISDTGSGITDEIKSKIFDPFFTTKGEGEGTGLGLSLSQEIVKKFNGDIAVESELGKGTCFKINFPALDQNKK